MNATSNFSRERRPSIPPNSSTTGDHGIEKKADAKPTRIFRPSSLSNAIGMHSDAASQGGGWLCGAAYCGFESGSSLGSTWRRSVGAGGGVVMVAAAVVVAAVAAARHLATLWRRP
jgi:hypothetical protein